MGDVGRAHHVGGYDVLVAVRPVVIRHDNTLPLHFDGVEKGAGKRGIKEGGWMRMSKEGGGGVMGVEAVAKGQVAQGMPTVLVVTTCW